MCARLRVSEHRLIGAVHPHPCGAQLVDLAGVGLRADRDEGVDILEAAQLGQAAHLEFIGVDEKNALAGAGHHLPFDGHLKEG